ncbi:MAG TPA: hypothetical protein VI320_30900, partial [Terracidiphilus sp.]
MCRTRTDIIAILSCLFTFIYDIYVILSEAKDLLFSPSATVSNVRTAPAQKLYNKELTRDLANKEVNLYD